MEITRIKYFKVTCSNCQKTEAIDLSLYKKTLFCHSCGANLKPQDLDIKAINRFNKTLVDFCKKYMVETGDDGLIISKQHSGLDTVVLPFDPPVSEVLQRTSSDQHSNT